MLSGLLKNMLGDAIRSAKHWVQEKLAIANGTIGSALAMSKEEAACRRTLKSMPHFAEAYIGLGIVLKDRRRLVEAEAAFRHALNLEGKNAAALYNLGIILAQTSRPWEAELAYRSA